MEDGLGYATTLNSSVASGFTPNFAIQVLNHTFTGTLYAKVVHGPLVNLTLNQTLPADELAEL